MARELKALVAGWFSFEYGHGTAGDVLSAEVACEWLREAGIPFDVAAVPPFDGNVDWRAVDPASYTHAVFVCGPFNPRPMETAFLERFAECRLIGLNLTLAIPLASWNPFDLLLERDSPAGARPDMVFASPRALVPVIGVCLVEDYEGERVRVQQAHAVIERVLGVTEAALVRIDTRLDTNETGLRTPAEIESLIARMDAVVTTRLHGTVLALKNGVPPLVVDPEAGGAKLRRQVERLGWPVIFNADELAEQTLREALTYCLSEEARARARECAELALRGVDETRRAFLAALEQPADWERSFVERVAARRSRGDEPGPPLDPYATPSRDRLFDRGRTLLRTVRRLPGAVISARSAPPIPGRVRFGDLRRTEPISREFGFDRGQPIDRHYIESFLERHRADVRGRVLEVGDDSYTRRFGGARATQRDVLHIEPGHPAATIVADLASAAHVPDDTFDCIILTQTLHLVYDVQAGVDTLYRILKPGGVLLATVPGITQTSADRWADTWYWAFTCLSARRLLESRFPADAVEVETWGNVLAATAFLQGLAAQELRPEELAVCDVHYQLLITMRAQKATAHEADGRSEMQS